MATDDQPPAEPMPEPALLALARKTFEALSRAEEELFRAAQEGRPASVRTGDEEKDNPAHAAKWPADRAVRAQCISWVCTDVQASLLVTHYGLHLRGMRIDGELDLGYAEIKFPFTALQCAFSQDIVLQSAQLREIYLGDCQLKGLDASWSTINASIGLRDGFKANGEVNLDGARIDGNLDCDHAQFSKAEGFALTANGAEIEGAVLLRDVNADGEVNLLKATIGAGLECDRSQFLNAGGLAFNANGAKIDGSVFFRGAFKAEGEVNLRNTTIGGGLSCVGAQFSNRNGFALAADGAKIQGSVYLRSDFKADGEVNLIGIKIGGDLDCSGAHFSNAKRFALNAERSRIESTAFLRKGFRAQGAVNLVGATIASLQIRDVGESDQMILDLRRTQVGAFCDDEKSWPKAGNLFLDGFRYERLFEEAPFEADTRKKWLSLQPRDRFRPQPYEQLAAVLRQMGHEPEARQIMIEKNRERARFADFPHQSWWWYNLFGKLIGYGYRPWRAFALSAAMILLGTFLFYVGFAHDLVSPTSENAYVKAPNGQVIEERGRPKPSETYPVFNAFFYSLESFTPLLKLDQSANWTPNANRFTEISTLHRKVPTGSLLRYYLYFHIAAGWLLTSLWVGAITGLVKT